MEYDYLNITMNDSVFVNSTLGIMALDPASGGGGSGSFFDTYFSRPRFIAEASMAVPATVINVLALVSSANARNKRYSIYHTLFINLCVCNVLSLVLNWLSNNILFLFRDSFTKMVESGTGMCRAFVFLTAAAFVCSAFSIVSILTLLGFIVVQYFAICRPLQHMALVSKQRVVIFLLLAWLFTIAGGFVPFFTLLYLSSENCDGSMLLMIFRVQLIGTNCCISVMMIIYTSVVVVCFRIYLEIKQLQKRLSQFRYDQEVQGERTAFITTLMLIGLLTVFYIPYTSVYVISINNSGGADIHSSALIYYMNLLPYVKYFLDPLIYGLRMKEIREGCRRFCLGCGCYRCGCIAREHVPLSPSTSVTCTMRMRSFTNNAAKPNPGNIGKTYNFK